MVIKSILPRTSDALIKTSTSKLKRLNTFSEMGEQINVVIDPSKNTEITNNITTSDNTGLSESRNNNSSNDKHESEVSNDDSSKYNSENKENTVTKVAFNPNHTIGYKDVVTLLKDVYQFDENANSTALDILALYLRGQKIIYMESKTYCESRLNSLMIPAIFIAAGCSILNYILKDYQNGTIIISSLNAFNSFILTIINYLKLAEKSQNHLIAAQRFHNLEARLELQSGRSLFFNNPDEIKHALEEMEKEIKEIQSSDQFLVPEAIRYRYPKIFSSNIFSLVKKIKNEEILYINELKTAVQKIYEHTKKLHEWKELKTCTQNEMDDYKEKIHELELELEIYNIMIEHDSNNIADEQKLAEYGLVLYNNPIYDSSLESIPEEKHKIIPPKLELPDSNLESNVLYAKIVEWKKKYDEFLSNKKLQDEQYNIEYKKIQEIYDKKNQQKEEKLRIRQLKINIKHFNICLNESEELLNKFEISISEEEKNIEDWDKKKDIAFKEIVSHRQRYIKLNGEMNYEIQKNISEKNKWYNCSPYSFFNT